jgi:hypothetical protein
MSKRRVTFELDIPEFIDSEDVQAWVAFALEAQPTLPDAHPLSGQRLVALPDSVLVVDVSN